MHAPFLPCLFLRGALPSRALAQPWGWFARRGKAPLELAQLHQPWVITPLKLLCLCAAATRKKMNPPGECVTAMCD